MQKRLIYGFAFNDYEGRCSNVINGKKVSDPRYRTWMNILQRAFCENYKSKFPTYKSCSVCKEWLSYKNFKEWMDSQDWVGKQIDKDILVKGNKIYSPEFCVFVSKETNYFLTASDASRGDWPLGVNWHKAGNAFVAQCNNPFTKKREYLGLYKCPNQAHEKWLARKRELAIIMADQQTDIRVAEALRVRY
jgi:hypothetical protein